VPSQENPEGATRAGVLLAAPTASQESP
jgi:hypothetical protein